MRDVLIDLGEMPTPREAPAGTVIARPPFPFRVVLGALTLLLVALLAGAAPHLPPDPPTILPARLGDATFVDGDRLYVISSGRRDDGVAVQNRVISTYTLPGGRLLGQVPVAVSGAVTWVWQGAGTLVVSYQVAATGAWAVVAADAGTGRVRWRRPARWIGGSAPAGLVILDTETSDPGSDTGSSDTGSSDTGSSDTDSSDIRAAQIGVELGTGQIRWSVPRPRDGFTAPAGDRDGFPRWLVTVTDSGRLATRDALTGAVLSEVAVPRLTGRANGLIWPVGDLIMVDTGGGGFDAYRLPGLRKVWHTTADLSQSWTQADCGRLICTFRQQRGMTALDAATGREAWRSDRWIYAEAVGAYLLATADDGLAQTIRQSVLDPATGRVLGDFGSWQVLGAAGNGLLYGKLDGEAYHAHFGLLDPATRRIRLIGSGDRISGDCETSGDVLVCRRTDASVAVWRLR